MNTHMPINSAHTTRTAACSVERIASNVAPTMTKTNWVTTPTVVSTTMLAAACAPGTPRR
jgi:hypothetical protein